ncbi:odorant receptor 47a-like [Osmia lignaria lignaria]|uniref:odorant receptor 47a-like n=1 Tax=Osmia lignaria lignaria TaxID=1437193 RepID=UPI00402B622E
MEHDYQRNVNLSTQLSRWLLKPLGAWPKSSNTSLIEKYFTWFMYAVCYLLIIFLIVPCLTFLILEVKGTYNKIKLIGPLSFFLMSFMKYNLILFHKNDILKCVEKIEWNWRNMKDLQERNIMVMNMNYGRRLIIVYASFVYGSFVFYYIIMPLSGGKIPAGDANFTFIPLPFPSSLRITDYRKSPVNEIFFVAQCLSGILLDAVTVGTCSLAATFATHACGQMEVLMNWLEHLVNGRSGMSQSVDGRIASIVEQHIRVLNFLALIEKMFQTISCIECLGCMMNLCLLGYYLIMEWNGQNLTSSFTYISLIVYFGLNIFVFCYTGELVAEQCRRVGETSYMTDWYRLSGKKKLCCILIIAMSNSSIKLTAGNMIELSISTFSDVVRTAVAFLNMLRALT